MGNNILDTANTIFPLSPHRLISLWDMNEFFTAGLVRRWVDLVAIKRDVEKKQKAEIPTPAHIGQLNVLLQTGSKKYDGLLTVCVKLQMAKSQNRIEHFLKILNATDETPSFAVINSELGGLTSTMQKELIERKFVFVPADKVEFFEQDKLFEDAVYKKFPEARREIKEAGNCFAADLNTAAVFHLMRATEWGLRDLAEHLDAVPAKWPIEFSQWSQLIDDIDLKLNPKVKAVEDTMTRGHAKDASLEFYNGLVADVKHLKISRDRVMHTRESYNEKSTMAIFGEVENFMKRLANRPSICSHGGSGEITKEAAKKYADNLPREVDAQFKS